ncbi:NifU family protein [Roseivirga sp. BDSF3-8]|uniref:NifU family protein n=1 Tax=Roseivirga sp. BDSF3-8 TaxID=3241598 RepID=UPI0035321152
MNTETNTVGNRQVHIYMEASPNPNSLKFVANSMLVPEAASFDYPSLKEAGNSPLAQALFESFTFVERVFIMSNFVTVTKNDEKDWQEIQTEVRTFVKEYLEQGKPAVDLTQAAAEEKEKEASSGEETETEAKIKQVLDEYIRPAVEQDGGAIAFHSFENGVVKVLLQGSCSGCPSSTITLKAGIENLLKRAVPEVETVEAEGV